ncbi:MAG: DUF2970 domain-containing protein [Cellvibrionales bacterium]|nr:DUF2970 domain-containing protein [Cellvibrionales bacterium]
MLKRLKLIIAFLLAAFIGVKSDKAHEAHNYSHKLWHYAAAGIFLALLVMSSVLLFVNQLVLP